MKLRHAGLSLIEAIVSLSFIALLGIAIAVVLRGFVLESAASSVKNRLEQSSIRVLTSIREDLRFASRATVALSDPEGANGPRVLELRRVQGFSDTTGDPIVGPGVIRYEVNANNEFVRTADGLSIPIAALAEPREPEDYTTGPGLSFERISTGTAEICVVTVRVRARRSDSGEFESRSLIGRVNLVNP